MTVALAAQPSNKPLPTGQGSKLRPVDYGAVTWPGAGAWFYAGPGAGGSGMQVGPFQSTERFWLACGANLIIYVSTTWTRFDWQLRLATPGGQVSDLNGIGFFQKADSMEAHNDYWTGRNIEGKFHCEKNTAYYVQLLSLSNSASTAYGQWVEHMNLWGYTIGEGVE